MELLDNKKKEYMQRLLLARIRILNKHSFYGLLLMNTKFGLDLNCDTAYTDGTRICFSPKFVDELSDSELDFILMHEILHIVLRHCERNGNLNNIIFNIACDIVVNSNILKSNDMDIKSITLKCDGEAMHIAPDGKEGYLYTAEEVYEMLIDGIKELKFNSFDIHDHWGSSKNNQDLWDERIVSAISALKECNGIGKVPLGILREYNKLINPVLNWREILKDFLSKDIYDYSFNKTDKRYTDVFLPDFSEECDIIKLNILFVVDTSGSITNKDLGKALAEINSVINESDHLDGYILCLDAKTYDLVPLSEFDINTFQAHGGGGTDFTEFFNNLNNIRNQINSNIDLIIFMTDGRDTFPNEELRQGIPLLWIINNDEITPPWGMIARIID